MLKGFRLKLLNWIKYSFFLVISVLLLLELCFRFQLIDFYRSELELLNPDLSRQAKNGNVLIIGDSFSAYPEAYVRGLRAAFPDYNFINASVSGTGIRQHRLYAKDRIQEFKPKHIIYQFYVGNDFTDLRHPWDSPTIGWTRKAYWWLSERILVLQYLNYRLSVINLNDQALSELEELPFSAEYYNKRVGLYFQADPKHLQNSLLLDGKQQEVAAQWTAYFEEIQAAVPEDCTLSLLLIPSCAQVNSVHMAQMQQIGAELSDEVLQTWPPLYQDFQQLEGIQLLNPLEAFRKTSMPLYYHNDPHLSPQGQAVLADFLIREWKSEN